MALEHYVGKVFTFGDVKSALLSALFIPTRTFFCFRGLSSTNLKNQILPAVGRDRF